MECLRDGCEKQTQNDIRQHSVRKQLATDNYKLFFHKSAFHDSQFFSLTVLSNVATAKIYPFLRKKSISTQNFPYVVCRFVVFNCLAYLFYIKVFITISFLKVSFTRKTKTTYDKRHLTLTFYLRAYYIYKTGYGEDRERVRRNGHMNTCIIKLCSCIPVECRKNLSSPPQL